MVIVFTGESGEQHGYADGWTPEGTFRYFGEGQVGDMVFERGNRAVRDHLFDGKDLLVFQTRGREGVRFLGQFECGGYNLERAPDREGQQRTAIVFSLIPTDGYDLQEDPGQLSPGRDVDQLAVLRQRALEAARTTPQVAGTGARRLLYQRSEAVRKYVLARAGGVCESCD
jgi:5-methylcytosine-specific restriction protein A